MPVTASAHGRAITRPSGSITSRLERDQESTSRTTARSSNGIVRPAISIAESAPLPAITTTSPGRGVGEGRLDGAPPVEHDLQPAVCDLGRDLRRILGPRVVGRHDRAIGEPRGGAAHQRPLLAVTVAAGAEDDDQPPAAETARRLEHVDERVGRVRVVDDHGERLSGLDRLESARHAGDRRDPAADRVLVDPELASRPDRTERVRSVEAAAQLQIDAFEIVVGRERPRVGKIGGEPSSPTRRRR